MKSTVNIYIILGKREMGKVGNKRLSVLLHSFNKISVIIL